MVMGNPRTFTRNFNARNRELETALKGAGVRSDKRRRELMSRAAAARPADLAEQAREAINQRRLQRALAVESYTSPAVRKALLDIAGRAH